MSSSTSSSVPSTPVSKTVAVTHIAVLLDESGSMESIRGDVIGGFNRFIDDQRKDGNDAKVTLVKFDSQDPHNVVLTGVPIGDVSTLTPENFTPRGSTPLLDATGRLIGRIRTEQEGRRLTGLPVDDIVFVTITDGEENDSSEYSLRRIKQLVEESEAAGWTFVFLSAGLDAYGESQGMGVKPMRTQAFKADAMGTDLAFQSLSSNMTNLRGKKRRGESINPDEFFEDGKIAEMLKNEDES
jgi:uncharacterized protein YegL